MLGENKDEILSRILEVLPSMIDEEGVFNLNAVIKKCLLKVTEATYEEDYLDVKYYSDMMLDYLISNRYCDVVNKNIKELKIADKTKKIINFIEPKKDIVHFGDIEKIAKDTFDIIKVYKVNIGYSLRECLVKKYNDVKYTDYLLQEVTQFLINNNLLNDKPEMISGIEFYQLTDYAKEIKQVGTLKKYSNKIKIKQIFKIIEVWAPIIMSLLALGVSCTSNDNKNLHLKIDNLQKELNQFKDSINKEIYLLKEKNEKHTINNISSVYQRL